MYNCIPKGVYVVIRKLNEQELREVKIHNKKSDKLKKNKLYKSINDGVSELKNLKAQNACESNLRVKFSIINYQIHLMTTLIKDQVEWLYFSLECMNWRIEFANSIGSTLIDSMNIASTMIRIGTKRSVSIADKIISKNIIPHMEKYHDKEEDMHMNLEAARLSMELTQSILLDFVALGMKTSPSEFIKNYKSLKTVIFVEKVISEFASTTTKVDKNSEEDYTLSAYEFNSVLEEYIETGENKNIKNLLQKLSLDNVIFQEKKQTADKKDIPLLGHSEQYCSKKYTLEKIVSNKNQTNQYLDYIFKKYNYLWIKDKEIDITKMEIIEYEDHFISVVSLLEKIFFTFVKIISGKNDIEEQLISPKSNVFWQKITPIIATIDATSYKMKIVRSFIFQTFEIWSDFDFGNKYKKRDDGLLRNIIIHRNPLGNPNYKMNQLTKEVRDTLPKLEEYIRTLLLLVISEENNFTFNDIKKEKNIVKRTNVAKGKQQLCFRCNTKHN